MILALALALALALTLTLAPNPSAPARAFSAETSSGFARKDFSDDPRSATAFWDEELERRIEIAVRPQMQVGWLHAVLDKAATPDEMSLVLEACATWGGKGWDFDEAAGEKFVAAALRCDGAVAALHVLCKRRDRLGAFTPTLAMAELFRGLPRAVEDGEAAVAALEPAPEATVAQMVLKACRSMDWRDAPAGPADAPTLLAAAEVLRDHGAEDTMEKFRKDFSPYLCGDGARAVAEGGDAAGDDDATAEEEEDDE